MNYVFGAYGAFFLLLGTYVTVLIVRHRRLRKQGA
ncbi:MAG: heme exporter protein CcmD [Candidatus Dadabacteria bacterium]|nr:MAG: heme exporter protein CcmD [Candidatus Dadabacteria bacterium]